MGKFRVCWEIKSVNNEHNLVGIFFPNRIQSDNPVEISTKLVEITDDSIKRAKKNIIEIFKKENENKYKIHTVRHLLKTEEVDI